MKPPSEQCHSGGFNPSVIAKSTAARTSIASACEELKNSIGGADFDPFARDWIAAMRGLDPYGNALAHNPDTNNNGKVTAKEAFDYADSVHHPYDTPVFNSVHGGGGCWLGRDVLIERVPTLEFERIIRRWWPEPDPRLREERLGHVLEQIAELRAELEPEMRRLHRDFAKRVTEIVKDARRMR